MSSKKFCPLSFNLETPMRIKEKGEWIDVNARFCYEDQCVWWVSDRCVIFAILEKLEDIRQELVKPPEEVE
ncbi:MAG: hypothetical protein QXQ94_11400 [Candidatus Bathyarchaeia archaeon]